MMYVLIDKTDKMRFQSDLKSGQTRLPEINALDIDKLRLGNDDCDAYVYDDAELEIDCFDSTYTVIRSENLAILERLAKYFEVRIRCHPLIGTCCNTSQSSVTIDFTQASRSDNTSARHGKKL